MDADAPENFSLRLAEPGRSDQADPDQLYEGYEEVARSQEPGPLVELLLRRLDDYDDRHRRLLALRAVAFCSDRDAVLLPITMASMLPRMERPFRRLRLRWTGRSPASTPTPPSWCCRSGPSGGPRTVPISGMDPRTTHPETRRPLGSPNPAAIAIRSWLLPPPAQRARPDAPDGDEDLLPRLLSPVDRPGLQDPVMLQRVLASFRPV